MRPSQEDTCASCQCGPNSIFQTINDKLSCACLPDFIGSPPNCRPECVSNSECSSNLACIDRKCKDPCPGSCGSNTECRVVSHTPMCACLTGFTGDPFAQCIPKRRKIYYTLQNLKNPWSKLFKIDSLFSRKNKINWTQYRNTNNRTTKYSEHEILQSLMFSNC